MNAYLIPSISNIFYFVIQKSGLLCLEVKLRVARESAWSSIFQQGELYILLKRYGSAAKLQHKGLAVPSIQKMLFHHAIAVEEHNYQIRISHEGDGIGNTSISQQVWCYLPGLEDRLGVFFNIHVDMHLMMYRRIKYNIGYGYKGYSKCKGEKNWETIPKQLLC